MVHNQITANINLKHPYMKSIGKYRNGNYSVIMLEDGTKIRFTNDDEMIPAFAENCDVKLTDKCSVGCKFCYEGCTPSGRHSVIDFDSPFLQSLHPYTELALNGNDMDHPQLEELLEFLKQKKVFANITVNQKQLSENYDFIADLQARKLIWGIGVSLTDPNEELFEMLSGLDNAVIHTIAGVLTESDVQAMKNRNLKLLILGYKDMRRGHAYLEAKGDEIETNTEYLKENLSRLPKWFSVVSFDNLALKQIDVRSVLSDEEWETFYMGDDGTHTFYIDLVSKEFAMNSVSEERFPMLGLTVDEMFDIIRRK